MRSKFDEQLEMLSHELIRMGGLCENAIASSAKALIDGDKALAEQVTELSAQIDRAEREIEGRCLRLLLQQQPVAKDLRVISAALKLVTDMERIGDQSADIAEIMLTATWSGVADAAIIQEMTTAVIHMVTESVDAFVKQDGAIAAAVIAYDNTVDACFLRVKEKLIGRLSRGEADGTQVLDLLMIAKYLERIGDHAENIANWVQFSLTGTLEKHP